MKLSNIKAKLSYNKPHLFIFLKINTTFELAPATSSSLIQPAVLICKVFYTKYLFIGEQSARRDLGNHLGLANIGNYKKRLNRVFLASKVYCSLAVNMSLCLFLLLSNQKYFFFLRLPTRPRISIFAKQTCLFWLKLENIYKVFASKHINFLYTITTSS